MSDPSNTDQCQNPPSPDRDAEQNTEENRELESTHSTHKSDTKVGVSTTGHTSDPTQECVTPDSRPPEGMRENCTEVAKGPKGVSGLTKSLYSGDAERTYEDPRETQKSVKVKSRVFRAPGEEWPHGTPDPRTGGADRDEKGRFRPGNRYRAAKGHPGYPNAGRPKKPTLRGMLTEHAHSEAPPAVRRAAAKVLGLTPGDLRGITFLEAMAAVALGKAGGGDGEFWREVGDRLDPKPRRVEISSPGGGPLDVAMRVGRELSEAEASDLYRRALKGGGGGDPEEG